MSACNSPDPDREVKISKAPKGGFTTEGDKVAARERKKKAFDVVVSEMSKLRTDEERSHLIQMVRTFFGVT